MMTFTQRKLAVVVAATLACTLSASAQTFRAAQTPRASARAFTASKLSSRRVQDTARVLLRTPVKEVDWDEVTFEEVIEWLSGLGGDEVNILLRWKPLGVVAVDQDSTITLRLFKTNLGEVLNEVMDQLSEDGEVTFHGIENKLIISTKQNFARKQYTKAYPVADLLVELPDYGRTAPIVDLQAAARAGGKGGGGGGQGIFGGGSSGGSEDLEVDEAALEKRLNDIQELVKAMIFPETWIENGGRGVISVYDNRMLIVRNSIEVHEELAGFFTHGR